MWHWKLCKHYILSWIWLHWQLQNHFKKASRNNASRGKTKWQADGLWFFFFFSCTMCLMREKESKGSAKVRGLFLLMTRRLHCTGYIIIKYLQKTCRLRGFSPSHNRVCMMNVRCKTRHQRRRTKCARCTWCQSVRFKCKSLSSPMLGCFSKRQILASLSSFWWSVETQTRVNTGYYFFFFVLVSVLRSDWLPE